MHGGCFIFLLHEIEETPPKRHSDYRLDSAALQNAVPFLSRLPKLHYCFVGEMEKEPDLGASYRDGIPRGFGYVSGWHDGEGHGFGSYGPGADGSFSTLIHSICNAYETGRLSTVYFDGLIDDQKDVGNCPWQLIAKIQSYRSDVECQVCYRVCSSFPFTQVFRLSMNTKYPATASVNACKWFVLGTKRDSQTT